MSRALRLPAQDAPFSAINITPLIDVMLVLMIMMIITIPIATHKIPVDSSSDTDSAAPPPRLDITASGALRWDGRPISDAQLPAAIAASRAAGQQALLMRTDPEARDERFDQVLATVKSNGVEQLGFLGHEAMRD